MKRPITRRSPLECWCRYDCVMLRVLSTCLAVVACGEELARPEIVVSVELTPGTVTLTSLAETAQLTATAHDADGATVAQVAFDWSSSDVTVATVGTSGLVSAQANGAATVTATAPNGVSGSASVTVLQEVAYVSVTPPGASVSGVGVTQTFVAEALDANRNPMSWSSLGWSSLNPNVATIDQSGTATTVATGQVTIAADVDGTKGYALITASVPGVTPVASWTPDSLPANDLKAVWGSSSSDIFAVGRNGTVTHFDGIEWQPMTSGVTSDWFEGVWGTSSTDVYAVGEHGLVYHYDGTEWSRIGSPSDAHLEGVWGASPNDVFTVGWQGWILHYDGMEWSTMVQGGQTSPGSFNGVWGTSSSDVYAVGAGGRILHYDGTGWSEMASGTDRELFAVWGTSSADVYAVGFNGTVLHYDGSQWSAMTSGTAVDLYGAWGTSSSDIYVVGNNRLILHYDGTDWMTMSTVGFPRSMFAAVWGSLTGDVYAVGDDGWVLRGQR